MAQTSDGTFTHVRGELAWTIAEHRTPCDAIAMVEHLDASDEAGHPVIRVVSVGAPESGWGL